MKGFVYVPPTEAQLDALMSTPDVLDAMGDGAEAARAYAESIAPVDTGAYRDRFRVEVSGGVAHLVNDDEGAAAIEWGKGSGPGHLTLTQTADWVESGG